MEFFTKGTAILGAVLLASSAFAQSLNVSPGNVLRLGQTATITYVNKGLADSTVVVTVLGGFPIPTVIEIPITLDADGKGAATWVPSDPLWFNAVFSAPGVVDVTVPIA